MAIVLVHHVRKAGSEDFLTVVSGTNAIAGAADATLVLKRARGQGDGILHVTGRELDEAEYALSFQPAFGAWRLLDSPVTDHTVGDTRATILRYVRAHPAPSRRTWREVTALHALQLLSDHPDEEIARAAALAQRGVREGVPGRGTPSAVCRAT